MPNSKTPEQGFRESEQTEKALWAGETPERFRRACELVINRFTKERNVEGKEHLLELPKDRRVVIASSHLSNLDVPLVVDTLGDKMNLQIAVMSTHFKDVRRLLLQTAGKESFSPIAYVKKEKRQGIFEPQDFDAIQEVVEREGKVPWIALHALSKDGKMKEAKIGPAYLAEILDALVLPVAVEVKGEGSSLEGAREMAKAFKNKLKATVRIDAPLELPKIDLQSIQAVLVKRSRGEAPSSDEKRAFLDSMKALRSVTNTIARTIAELLPPEQRGVYGG